MKIIFCRKWICSLFSVLALVSGLTSSQVHADFSGQDTPRFAAEMTNGAAGFR